MEASKKDMLILKNLPSNLIEEAIVILKENNKIKNYQYVEEKRKMQEKNIAKEKSKKESSCVKNVNNQLNNLNKTGDIEKEKDYIIKEAEMIISNYISELEKKSPRWKNNMKKLEEKYKKSLKLNVFLIFISIISFILSIL